MSTDANETDNVISPGGIPIEPGGRLGPYIYRRLAGRGAMAYVVLATDPDGRPVAVKILKANRFGTGLSRFKREFRALARLRHPNVIRVDAYGDIHGHPYIVMEYVEGHDLHAAIHSFRMISPEERWRRCEAALVDLCRALAYIHRRGLIHRDLKPSNVLIDADGRCKLTDFGIVKDLDPAHDTQLSNTLVGTWAYASVEQMSGGPIDHRSDLYSLGVILFAMLTGRRPFNAKDLAGYLEAHRLHVAPSPREIDPDVPEHLDAICRRLMQKEPRDRFRSAQEVLFLLERHDAIVRDDDILPLEAAAWVPPIVGRTEEEAALRGHVSALTRGEGGLVVVEGAEGVGKTRMLEVVADQAQVMGFSLHREAAGLRDAPLGPMLRLAVSLATELGDRAPADLVAALATAGGDARGATSLTRDQLQESLVESVQLLLEEGPVVLVLDDLHHAQAPTLAVLEALRARTRGSLLVVGAVRSDVTRGRLSEFRTSATGTLRLGPLARTAVAQMIDGLVGPGRAAQALTERLHRETEGNVLFLVLFLQNLMYSGMLVANGPRWRLTADPDEIESGHVDVPLGVRQVVRARLAPLTEPQHHLVDVICVHGRDMDLDVLLDVLDQDEDVVAPILARLEDLGILSQRTRGPTTTVDFTHAKFADVLYRELDDDHRADLHRDIAAALEKRFVNVAAVAEMVGEHYRRAGDAGKAYRYLATAARRFVERGMPNEALEVLGRSAETEDGARVDLDPAAFAAARNEVLVTRAEVQAIRGELASARETVTEALELLAEGQVPEEAALRARVTLAQVLRSVGDPDGAEAQVHLALPRARILHARDVVAEGLFVLAAVAWTRRQLDACEARAQEGLLLATGPQLARPRARLLLTLSTVQATRGQHASAVAGLSEAQVLLKDLRLKPIRAFALANLAEVLLGQGDVSGAWAHATEALEEATTATHRLGEIAAHDIRGLAAVLCGATDIARSELEASLAATKLLRDPTEGLSAAMNLGRLALENNEPDVALDHLDDALKRVTAQDPEHTLPLVQALRAQALGRRALALPEGARAARQALDEAARSAYAAAEGPLATLPLLRRAQVTLDLARARAIFGDFDGALPLARGAVHLASMRGFRLLALDALAVQAFVTSDEAERTRLASELAEYVAEVAMNVPPTWQGCFRARLGLPADA